MRLSPRLLRAVPCLRVGHDAPERRIQMSQHLSQHRGAILGLTSLAAGAAVLAGAIVGLPTAGAQQGELEVVDGNPKCADLGYANGFKVDTGGELPDPGTYTVGDPGTETEGDPGDFEVTISYDSEDPVSLAFETNTPVDAVLMKAGDGGFLYKYDPPVTSDSGLESPTEDSLSHVTFCWNDGMTTTSSSTTTTSTTTTSSTTTTMPGKTTTTKPTKATTTTGPVKKPTVTTTKPSAGATTVPGQPPRPGTAQPASPVPGRPAFTG